MMYVKLSQSWRVFHSGLPDCKVAIIFSSMSFLHKHGGRDRAKSNGAVKVENKRVSPVVEQTSHECFHICQTHWDNGNKVFMHFKYWCYTHVNTRFVCVCVWASPHLSHGVQQDLGWLSVFSMALWNPRLLLCRCWWDFDAEVSLHRHRHTHTNTHFSVVWLAWL